jgi:hypothetical protein
MILSFPGYKLPDFKVEGREVFGFEVPAGSLSRRVGHGILLWVV